ncbi:hypothetical protein [Streptomyces sp. Rer75]|uniref:hypothetical protein n=1 Tax=unclassified Streptomyces TaxID=2593676 RepID=UPI0015CFA80D|nr:hypothetical protein [Streptomyces sp. Rer75]QLH19252.1 hypothetical protein HYQ63_05640 [Streptomyces sp. Rer75]
MAQDGAGFGGREEVGDRPVPVAEEPEQFGLLVVGGAATGRGVADPAGSAAPPPTTAPIRFPRWPTRSPSRCTARSPKRPIC